MYKFLKNVAKAVILFFLQIRVIYISNIIKKENKKNIFLDLGTNLGQGFFYFKKFFKIENYEYILVEPNPNLKNFIQENIIQKYPLSKITFINKAAYIKDIKKKLYGLTEDERGILSEGASIYREHNSNLYESDETKSSEVECFDIISYLKELNHYDNIIIKMDIEGSEYDILEKLIENSSELQNIKHIFIEFHSRFMKKNLRDKYYNKEKILKKKLKEKKINYTLWV